MKNFKKILVALSGGVDSAAAAAILKKQGFDVVSVHFLLCGNTWKLSFQVRKIARKLEIPLEIVDARKEFKKRVIDYFSAAHKNGLTPNPCVVCNKEMKFRLLFDLLKKYKADYVATGHYALIKVRPFPSPTFRRGIPQGRTLCEAKDKAKDQSYFLYRLNQKDLAKIIFPLGNYKKSDVKKITKEMKIPVPEKEESQDICFLLGENINSYLRKRTKLKPGNIVNEKGDIIGKHSGLSLYTLGQRKGIKIGGTEPYFVLAKNPQKNELVITNDPEKLLTKRFHVGRVNWIKPGIKFPLRAKVQIRYHAPKVSAIIRKMRNGKLEARCEKYLRAITPGQSAVFYKNGEVLGGGVIVKNYEV
ncbi:MAG: tRNA 2-thiouridine(34) synthase MnmA [Patescibacteria group bacterium]|nr:tRNA 2-thiouridine(34) synthase MnmA [Patescibacteria group bacterium]